MEPCYINDGAPIDTIINSRSRNIKANFSKVAAPLDTLIINNSSNNINHNNHKALSSSPKVVAYANTYISNMQKYSTHAEVELFRRQVVDGGTATTSSPPPPPFTTHAFNDMMPFTHHIHNYPLISDIPFAHSLSPSKPYPSSSSNRDSIVTLSDAIKEVEEQDGEGKMSKKAERNATKEEANVLDAEKREGEAQSTQGHEKMKKTSKRGAHNTKTPMKRAKASFTPTQQVLTMASSSRICSTAATGLCSKKEVLPSSPKPDFIHVRARRGQATDNHSLAERVRREKMREKMRFLQDLVPGCDKIIGKALMLDEIINYVQSLQHQVEFLAMKLAASHSKQIDRSIDDNFMDKEINFALAEVHGPCSNMVVQAMEHEWPSYHMQMRDLSSFVNVKTCDDEDQPLFSGVSMSYLI